MSLFGAYNGLCFLGGSSCLKQVCDRAHRKEPTTFEEQPLEDLLGTRALSEMYLVSSPPEVLPLGDQSRSTEQTCFPAGFGRGLSYQASASADGPVKARLVVRLPERVRYRVRWTTIERDGARFELPFGMSVRVVTDLPWSVDDGQFVVETRQAVEIAFDFESVPPSSPVQKTVLVAARGRERDAVLARATLGPGFVASLLWDATHDADCSALRTRLDRIAHDDVASVGVPVAARARTAKHTLLRLVAPDVRSLYGPALYLALAHDATLELRAGPERDLVLLDASDRIIHRWSSDAVLGVALQAEHPSAQGGDEELVICENTFDDLVVLQAVGYASMRGAAIAFIASIDEHLSHPALRDPTTAPQFLENVARKAVPAPLRAPKTARLVIFTRELPLHLTPLGDLRGPTEKHWVDRYLLCHLPGETASFLVPRFESARARVASPAPFSVVFDTLDDVAATEATAMTNAFGKGLSHSVRIDRQHATGDLLEAIANRLDLDLLLLTTHGADDMLEDGTGAPIEAGRIAAWQLRGDPLVVNNSCASWSTTGEAFITAGARAMVATLWPVSNDVAMRVAVGIAERYQAQPDARVVDVVSGVLRDRKVDAGADAHSRLAYVYVGLPEARLLSRPLLSPEEEIALVTGVLMTTWNTFDALVDDGRPDLAITLRQLTRDSLAARFRSLLVPGELPRHLPPPLQIFSVLDVDCLLASADVDFGLSLLKRASGLPAESILQWMGERLQVAVQELLDWNPRHERHIGTPEPKAYDIGGHRISRGALGEASLFRMLAQAVYRHVLPFATLLADYRQRAEAKKLLHLAALMVTTPEDVRGGEVTDEALLHRMSIGVKQKVRAWGGVDGTEHEIDILEGELDVSDLVNRFGIAARHLGEIDRARRFFATAVKLAKPGSREAANAASNLANCDRSAPASAASSFARLRAAVLEQERSGDLHNLRISASNLIRNAAAQDIVIENDLIELALRAADAEPRSAERERACCDAYGAIACYHASQGRLAEAREACEKIAVRVTQSHPVSSIGASLSELGLFFRDRGQYADALAHARWTAGVFARHGWQDDHARVLTLACAAALDLCAERPSDRRRITTFLSSSAELGRALGRMPRLRDELAEFVDGLYKNTKSVWEQTAEAGDHRLAVLAYRAAREWEPSLRDRAWERLDAGYHPLNVQLINNLARARMLRREGEVTLAPNGYVLVRLTTTYQAQGDGHHPVFCVVPTRGVSSCTEGGAVDLVAGCEVFELAPSARIELDAEDRARSHPNDRRYFHYAAYWGSRQWSYTLALRFTPGLVPLDFRWSGDPRPLHGTTLRCDEQGFHVDLAGLEGNRVLPPGPAALEILYWEDAKFWEGMRQFEPLAAGMKYAPYRVLVDLMTGRGRGSP